MANAYKQFALNNAYANRTIFGAIAGLSRDDFVAERPGFFPSICRTLNHIYEVDLFYIDALEVGGLGRSVFDRVDIDAVGDLASAQSEADMRLAMFCAGALDLDCRVPVERKSEMTTETVGALLPHLFQHQVHHRGQVHVQIGDAGIPPPQLDDFFLEHDRAPIAQEYF